MSTAQSNAEAAIGPGEMLDIYQNLEVKAGGNTVRLKVDAYRNLNYSAASKGGCDDAIKVKDALRYVAGADVWNRAGGASNYMAVFSGKGSPAAIQGVMSAFYDYSDKFIKTYKPNTQTPNGRISAWLADDSLSWEATLQNICHEFIGLDCNGFVGNWLRRCDPYLKIGPSSAIKDIYSMRGASRMSVDEIEYWDVIVWEQYQHIAAVLDEGGGGKPRFYICQSAGGGPRCNLYQIIEVKPGLFRLNGGIPAKDVGGNVYVINPWKG